MQERSEAERRAIMAMPQCCYLAKGAKRPSHTTKTIKFDRIPFDLCNSIKRFDLCPFDQKNSTYLQPPENFIFIGGYRVVGSQNCYLWFIVDITAQGTLFVSFFKNSERVILFTYRTGRRGLDPLRRHTFLQ